MIVLRYKGVIYNFIQISFSSTLLFSKLPQIVKLSAMLM